MLIKKLGYNSKEQFERNVNKFRYSELLKVYKQTLNPSILYTNDEEKSCKIKETFAYLCSDNRYVIFEYEGDNFIPNVQDAIANFLRTC